MKRTWTLILPLALLVVPIALSGTGSGATGLTCDGLPVSHHVHRAHALIRSAYDVKRADVDRSDIEKAQAHRRCIEIPAVRKQIGEFRDEVKADWQQARFRAEVTPFPGPNGTYWAIPAYIVACESGYDYYPDYGLAFGGAYGILVSTWRQYGGLKWADQANHAPEYAQDIVASRVWNDVGPSAWACA